MTLSDKIVGCAFIVFIIIVLIFTFGEQADSGDAVWWDELLRPHLIESDRHACMVWAFGEDFAALPRHMLNERWRDRHPDSPLIIEGHTPIDEAYRDIAGAYLGRNGHTNFNAPDDSVDVTWDATSVDFSLGDGTSDPNDPNRWVWTNIADMVLTVEPPHVSIHDIKDITFTVGTAGQNRTLEYDPNSNTLTLDGWTVQQAFKRIFYYFSDVYDPNEYLMGAEIVVLGGKQQTLGD